MSGRDDAVTFEQSSAPTWLGNGFGYSRASYKVLIGGTEFGTLEHGSLGWGIYFNQNGTRVLLSNGRGTFREMREWAKAHPTDIHQRAVMASRGYSLASGDEDSPAPETPRTEKFSSGGFARPKLDAGERMPDDCGHQGEDDCYGQCAFMQMANALIAALCQADHGTTCPARVRAYNTCTCWRAEAYAAIKTAREGLK